MAKDIWLDVSDALNATKQLMDKLNRDEAQKVLYRTLKETGARAKTYIKKDVAKQYAVTQAWVGKHVNKPKIAAGGGTVRCVVPVQGHRGIIGDTFQASGGDAHYKDSIRLRKKRTKIRARIVKGKSSVLPSRMSHQGGNPPFRVRGGGVTLTRRTKKAYPVVRVVGLSAGEMMTSRAEPEVEKDLNGYMARRLEHHAQRMLDGK